MSTWCWGCTSWERVARAVGASWETLRGGGSPQAGCRRWVVGAGTRAGRWCLCRAGRCDRGVDLPRGMLVPRGEKFWQKYQPREAAEAGDIESLVGARERSRGRTACDLWVKSVGKCRAGSTAETAWSRGTAGDSACGCWRLAETGQVASIGGSALGREWLRAAETRGVLAVRRCRVRRVLQ